MTLTIYEKHPHADAYRVGRAYVPYAAIAKDKRFTDAELLAQYWFCGDMGHSPVFRAELWRFASLPSYDEANA